MYLLERGFISARAIKSCVLLGMDWRGGGEKQATVE